MVLRTGCGGTSSVTQTPSTQTVAFSTSYASVTTQLEQITKAIGAAVRQAAGSSNAQLTVEFRDLSSRWQTQLSQLETLRPPPNLTPDFHTLTDAVSRVESDLNAIVAAAETNNKAAAEQAGASLILDVAAARSADAPIRRQAGIK